MISALLFCFFCSSTLMTLAVALGSAVEYDTLHAFPYFTVGDNCTGANKQKALYLDYDISPSLKDGPAADLSVGVVWENETQMRHYGANGIFAAQPFGIEDGVGGYFGSQVIGSNKTMGTLLFSIWDSPLHRKGPGPECDHALPNATWCNHKHAFPLSSTCRRHCLDCGLHPGWHNTTGTQCSVSVPIGDGTGFMFRLRQVNPNTTYTDPNDSNHVVYSGSIWNLTVVPGTPTQPRHTRVAESDAILLGSVFFERTFGLVDRLGAFHEHIGCTPCDAFFEGERRFGLTVNAPDTRTTSAITFNPPTTAECQLYNVKQAPLPSGLPSVVITTGPGTHPTRA
eukprot:m.393369 g.393369  ORF g.393369 m.393369 type:complete len:340 (+) comp21087_c1_seq21:223-1242(+)